MKSTSLTKISAFALCLVFIYILNSCKTNPLLIEKGGNEVKAYPLSLTKIKFEGDYLSFSDNEQFISTTEVVKKMTPLQIEAWHKDINFTPLDNNTQLVFSNLKGVLNQKGIVKIGNSFKLFKNDKLFSSQNKSTLESNELPEKTTASVDVQKTQHAVSVDNQNDPKARVTPGSFDGTNYCYSGGYGAYDFFTITELTVSYLILGNDNGQNGDGCTRSYLYTVNLRSYGKNNGVELDDASVQYSYNGRVFPFTNCMCNGDPNCSTGYAYGDSSDPGLGAYYGAAPSTNSILYDSKFVRTITTGYVQARSSIEYSLYSGVMRANSSDTYKKFERRGISLYAAYNITFKPYSNSATTYNCSNSSYPNCINNNCQNPALKTFYFDFDTTG